MAISLNDPKTGLNLQGSTAYITLITSVAALGAVMFGFDIAIISGAAPFVQERFALNDIQLGWGVSSLLLGCMAGSLVAGRSADIFGRRRTLLWVALVFAVTCIATALANNFTAFVLARIVGGLAVGAASIVSPMYIAEVSPFSIRGRMVSFSQLGITSGIVVSYYINYLLRGLGPNNWRWMFATGAVPSVAFFILLFVVPESPRWLYNSGRRDEAFQVLSRIGGAANAELEMLLMHAPTHQEHTPISEAFSPRYRRVLWLGIVLAVLVQASGINTIIEYSPIILRSAGNSIDMAMFQTFVIGIINFLATFVAIFMVDKTGRKPLYISGSLGMTISLLLIAYGFMMGHLQGYMGLALILLFITSFASCIGPVFWILISEIFPGQVRGTAMSIAVFATWLANFFVVLLFPKIFNHVGGAVTFLGIAGMALLMLLVAWKLVPETKGKTLEEIADYWNPSKNGN